MKKENNTLIDKQDLIITDAEKDTRREEELEIPQYKETVDLTDDQINRLKVEVFDFWQMLKDERASGNWEERWDNLDAQYNGEMDDSTNSEFNLNVPVTKKKVNDLVKFSMKAFFGSDPKFVITSRPGMVQEGKEEVCEHQEDYLDYLLDEEIDLKSPLRKVLHSGILKHIGYLKAVYAYERKKRKREEDYSGEWKKNEETGQREQPGLKLFLENYPQAEEEGNSNHKYFKRLKSGKDISIVVEFNEVVYNNPRFSHVGIKNLWYPLAVEGYQGLCDCQITVEKQEYTWWELKKKEKEGDFINVEDMKFDVGGKKEAYKNFQQRKYEVIEVVYWFNLENSDDNEDEIRLVCWFDASEKKVFLGAIYYPYYLVESYYIPFNITENKEGAYQDGLGEDLTDSHLAQNAVLNFTLTGAWIKNTVTPIVPQGSSVAEQFLENRWTHGIPIEVPVNDMQTIDSGIKFLEKSQVNTQELMNILLFMSKLDDDMSGISSLASGKETPLDPRAPAAKTAMLMKQSGISIEDYINCLLPSFNLIGEICLKLIYQMSKEGRTYKQKRRASQVTGQKDIFASLSRDEMVAKTNIQSRARAFAFDKIQEKQENLALYQILRQELAASGNRQGVHELVRTLIKSWNVTWKNKVDQIWPSPEQFQIEQVQLVGQALQIYLGQIAKQKEATGVEPQVDMNAFMQLFQQVQAQTLMSPEEKAKNEKER